MTGVCMLCGFPCEPRSETCSRCKESGARGKEFIFTFGIGQTHPCTGAPVHNRFVAIVAGSAALARAEMFRRFGKRWGNEYPTRELAGCQQYELRPLEGEEALGLSALAPFFGWAWRVGLRLASGQVLLLGKGDAPVHAEAREACEALADDYSPDDVVTAIVRKLSPGDDGSRP